MSENTGTATGPGGPDGRDDDEGLEPADAVPAGALASSASGSSLPVKKEGRIRSIGTFYRQVVVELRKVIWPTRRELLTYTSVVLVFVAVMVTIVSIFDFAFGRAVLEVFGDSSL